MAETQSRGGGSLTVISPAMVHFNPAIGAGTTSAGMILKGVEALPDAGKGMTRGGYFSLQAIRWTVDRIRNDAGAVRSAYSAIRGPGNPLDRGG
jgi:hypothetical protein